MKTRLLVALVAFAGIASGASLWVLGGTLAAPALGSVGEPPPGLGEAIRVEFPSKSGSQIVGWLARAPAPRGSVVLAHAVRSNRRSMAGRAAFLHASGYSVLLYDSQAHGESDGRAITFGFLEAHDAVAAVSFARESDPTLRVAFLGTSQGGAAALLAPDPLPVSALILEAVYPTLRDAVANRIAIRLGPLGRHLAPLLLLQLRPRLGVDPSSLEPIRGAARIRAPVLFIAGGADQHTTLPDSERLFRSAPEPKQLWVLPEARHQNFHALAGPEYERRVLEFLATYLR